MINCKECITYAICYNIYKENLEFCIRKGFTFNKEKAVSMLLERCSIARAYIGNELLPFKLISNLDFSTIRRLQQLANQFYK